jgi:hypothetical protein
MLDHLWGSPRMQGVGGIVKERIIRAAKGEARGERPMLLFPEVVPPIGLAVIHLHRKSKKIRELWI